MTHLHRMLQEARGLISDPKHWSRRSLAENKAGQDIDPSHEKAVKWCPLGALMRVGGHSWADGQKALHRQIAGLNLFVSEFNAKASHEEVLKMFDGAIREEAG